MGFCLFLFEIMSLLQPPHCFAIIQEFLQQLPVLSTSPQGKAGRCEALICILKHYFNEKQNQFYFFCKNTEIELLWSMQSSLLGLLLSIFPLKLTWLELRFLWILFARTLLPLFLFNTEGSRHHFGNFPENANSRTDLFHSSIICSIEPV